MGVTATINVNVEQIVKKSLENTFEQCENDFIKIAQKQADFIKSKMQDIVSVDKGDLKRSIDVVNSRKNNKFFWVGPQYSNRNSAFVGGNHAHLVEFGSKERYMKKGLLPGSFTRGSGGTKKFTGQNNYEPFAGKWLNKMPQKPFVRPTADNYGTQIIETLKNQTKDTVLKQGKRNGL